MRIRPGILLCGLVLAVAALSGEHANAHNRSQSFSSWTVDGDTLDMRFTVKAREVTRLPPLEGGMRSLQALLLAHLEHTIHVRAGEESCLPAGAPRALPAAPGYLRAAWSFHCPATITRTLRLDSFFAVASSHVHYARIAFGEGTPAEYLFTDGLRERNVALAEDRFDSFYQAFAQYTVLGIEHIFSGVDHIAFLLALMLLFRRLREVVWMVSGFTLGHSITLSLAALGWVVPNVSVIEALIGFTIALVAIENIGADSKTSRQLAYGATAVLVTMTLFSVFWDRGLPVLTLCGLVLFTMAYLPLSDSRSRAVTLRPLLTIGFGLIHGFGFASVLTEIGLPEQRLVPALAGFNIGVEIGQLVIVASLWCAARWITRFGHAQNYRPSLDAASAVLCALGTYWFVARGFALG